MSKIFYLMGKSSSGKDSMYKEILKAAPQLKSVVSYTTRPIRQGETNGVEYFFVSENELSKMKQEGKVIEERAYNTVHGVWKYFTVDDQQIDLKNNDYLLMGTPASYKAVRAFYGEERLVPIYLHVDDGIRLERALKREQSQENPRYEEMCRRYLADHEDFSEKNLQEAKITKEFNNENFQECLIEIVEYIERVTT